MNSDGENLAKGVKAKKNKKMFTLLRKVSSINQ